MDLIVRYFYTQDYNDNGLVAEIEEVSTCSGVHLQESHRFLFPSHNELTYLQNLIYHTFFPASDIHTSQNDEIKSSKDDEDNAILIPTAAQLHNCLLINSYIYSLAESLEIPKLKYLAVQKFISRLGDSGNWPYYQFSKIVAAVLKITTKDDRSLRVIVQDVLIEHASEILGREGQDCVGYHEGREDWLAVLRKDADFVLAIWEKTVASKQ